MPKQLKIVSVSAEVSPFTKTGGLADVAQFLPKALKDLKQDVIVITPFYAKAIKKKNYKLEKIFEDIPIHLNTADMKVTVWKTKLDKIPVYFIDNEKYFARNVKLYGSKHENSRFYLFDAACLEVIKLLKFKPDVIHCHDWHTGLIPYILNRRFKNDPFYKNTATLYTIHNLIFQGGINWWEVPLEQKDYGHLKLPPVHTDEFEYVNFAKRAILNADLINTVSERHRDEIMTKHFGQDLHRIIKNREKRVFGIVNGIDYNEYNPKNDPGLYKNYSFKTVIQNKPLNKEKVQKIFKLPVNTKIPLICTTSRVTFQKGFALIKNIMNELVRMDVQIIVIGAGDNNYIKALQKIAKEFPKKLAIIPSHEKNQKYETLVYAGSDMFLLPSHYEPCGINQLIAMRYGCIPIVRKVGGLYDTVINFNPTTNKGTGFTFSQFNEFSLFKSIIRALETYKYPDVWAQLVKRAMLESNSWEIPAQKYLLLYKKAIQYKITNGKKTKKRPKK